MAKKRFTDIEIWDKEWYMDLKPKHKCLMKYIFDKCDACGCWKPNWKLASLHIGEDVTSKDLLSLPKDQYEEIENGKIFIKDFINFQYGKLSKNSPAHNPVFSALEKNNLSNRLFNRVLDTLQEKDKEKDKDKEEDKESKPIKFSLEKIYQKSWQDYSTSLNGQAKHLSEIIFITWKEFVDFIWANGYEEVFKAKFVSPIDFGKLMKQNGFLQPKWKDVLERLLATGITPQQDLLFRIPQFLKYSEKDGKPTPTTVGKEIKFDRP